MTGCPVLIASFGANVLPCIHENHVCKTISRVFEAFWVSTKPSRKALAVGTRIVVDEWEVQGWPIGQMKGRLSSGSPPWVIHLSNYGVSPLVDLMDETTDASPLLHIISQAGDVKFWWKALFVPLWHSYAPKRRSWPPGGRNAVAFLARFPNSILSPRALESPPNRADRLYFVPWLSSPP